MWSDILRRRFTELPRRSKGSDPGAILGIDIDVDEIIEGEEACWLVL